MSEKFSQWKEHLEETYGKNLFVSKDWLRREWGRISAGHGAATATATVTDDRQPVAGNRELLTVSRKPIIDNRGLGTEVGKLAGGVATDSLEQIRSDLGDCRRCKLCEKRTNIAFGEGNPTARLMFVGEGPGEQEDLQGRPFVGKAGQLLDKIIEAMGYKRGDVYIANVVKCRPPGNRVPEPDEVQQCEPFLFRQIDTINPKVIVALGGTALKCLIHGDVSSAGASATKITQLRGKWIEYRGRKMLPTYHPAFLLRNPAAKKDVWEDMKKVLAELGGAAPKGGRA